MRAGVYTQRVGAATPSKATETPVALLTQVVWSGTSQRAKLKNELETAKGETIPELQKKNKELENETNTELTQPMGVSS